MFLHGLDGSILDTFLEEGSGDGAHHFVLIDEDGGGNVFAQFGDTGDETVVGGLVEEDGVIGFFFDFSLGPFLEIGREVLWRQPSSGRQLWRWHPCSSSVLGRVACPWCGIK